MELVIESLLLCLVFSFERGANHKDMPLSSAEKQRRYSDRQDANPDRREENGTQNTERRRCNKESGIVELMADQTPRQRRRKQRLQEELEK
ncbi:hypothetical protein CHARACLAT_004065 [Characodon lateralis]|uniref:Secreted protein n=1 Tax=Characodon lateralis TaxID=208331 RepID=A0ABU7F0F1_9TELE|nr:hypothetical protein [Characodon lateralis]